ncbi:hypothetical protein A3D77_05590 [Candidatus Gottesmanbacteria bacterium RIFCSPHIGHO2_02_FULL_39_11]|uniref:Dihydrofolate reductase n=1 Tax=Candidatus Gottesmanbacteria bacterium RIFCSPHIGHO2_02_FULL_39_11 TaxID=1798382 RepID=A0A1F5ZLF3_9BACT|nr:MAG: hypothetical protein A3D77_05590 [Candidatus Gottesmanbacteria bacterium RIFCSPHIGHO2_02_FULL_39_11]
MVSIISAHSENRVIGKNNHLPWNFPEDLKYFKDKTRGHTVIMGRKTYESMGRSLPNRVNIIISRNPKLELPDAITTASIEDALKIAKDKEKKEVFIIGGAEIYRQALSVTDKLYITLVKGNYEGDAFFPDYSEFKTIISQKKSEDGNLIFLELTR